MRSPQEHKLRDLRKDSQDECAILDEASSRFLDRIALDRLVAEKLERVQHYPTAPLASLAEQPLAQLLQLSASVEVRQSGTNTFLMRSVPNALDPEQDWYPVVAHPATQEKGSILFVHGLYEDNRRIHDFVLNGLRRSGYRVYVTTLPYHYDRTPASSQFSGEYFFSANLQRTKGAYCRSCMELYQTYQQLAKHTAGPLYVVGFSMGGTIALGVAAISGIMQGLFIINPAAHLPSVIKTSPLCQSIRRDLSSAGCDETAVDRALASFDPYFTPSPVMPTHRIKMAYPLYDEVTSVAQYQSLATAWHFQHVITYKAGHMNTLRLPNLVQDIVGYFDMLSSTDTAD